MARRVWTASVASALALAGWAQAQSPAAPASVPGAASGESSIITLKTAGQPERRVQVLKTEKLSDGKVLTEVRDLATGAVFTIADTKPLGPNLPMATPAAPSVGSPAPAALASSTLPQAKPRAVDPLLGGTRTATPAAPPQEYPTLVGRLRQNNTQAPVPSAPAKQSGISAALFGSYDTPRQPTPTLVGRMAEKPTQTANGARAGVFGSTTAAAETPTLANKLFGDKPTAVAAQHLAPPPVAATPIKSNILRPSVVAMTPPPPRPVETHVAMVPVKQPVQPPIQQVESLQPIRLDAKEPNFQVVAPKAMTMKQIEELVQDLRTNARPTNRLEAANALAACPMAGMVEVRQILAEATYRDPVPVVRAHCIEILTKMNYDEANYRRYVEGLVQDDEPAVQKAARAAVR